MQVYQSDIMLLILQIVGIIQQSSSLLYRLNI